MKRRKKKQKKKKRNRKKKKRAKRSKKRENRKIVKCSHQTPSVHLSCPQVSGPMSGLLIFAIGLPKAIDIMDIETKRKRLRKLAVLILKLKSEKNDGVNRAV